VEEEDLKADVLSCHAVFFMPEVNGDSITDFEIRSGWKDGF